ncbi:MAG: aminomethyl-transferring glycine dehydrogenase subunit GcvPA [Muribaculaceae bacterium]|nr:aminomethyl-transferring glycine dehydrogenase subunit GcvPA [Muribaculaceae bacterium]
MAYKYFPHTPDDIQLMLERCGMTRLDELYSDIPANLQLKRDYKLPEQMSDPELEEKFNDLACEIDTGDNLLGAGYYEHYTPAAIKALTSRSEFLTSYTPYQAEISQGTLQYIFEYQSMMAELTGMEVSNASMYDCATATAEAMLMAVAAGKKRKRVLVSETLSPQVTGVVLTYARFHGIDVDFIYMNDGVTDLNHMRDVLAEGDVAAVILASPNYYGIVEDYTGVADMVHEAKALLIMNCNASTLGVLKSPGEWGADIACGEAQSLGIPLSFGGPGLGFLCTSKKLIRKMPGRIVGATTDADGKRAFVLTLQAREQHIRREKATSNICSNQSLMALHATIYLALMGAKGLREVNELSFSAAHYLAKRLVETGLFRLEYPNRPFVNEFLLRYIGEEEIGVSLEKIVTYLAKTDAYNLGVIIDTDLLLVYTPETISKEDIDLLMNTLITDVRFELFNDDEDADDYDNEFDDYADEDSFFDDNDDDNQKGINLFGEFLKKGGKR